MRRKLWKMVVLPVSFTSCGTFVRPESYIHSWKSVLFGADWQPSVLSWNVLFNVFKKIVIWRKVWGVGTDGSMKDTHSSKLGSQGKWRHFDQIQLEGKYQRKSMLFWRYLAARTINEMVKKPSLRSAVACYLYIRERSAHRIEFIWTA